jgi:hypothetical protein
MFYVSRFMRFSDKRQSAGTQPPAYNESHLYLFHFKYSNCLWAAAARGGSLPMVRRPERDAWRRTLPE